MSDTCLNCVICYAEIETENDSLQHSFSGSALTLENQLNVIFILKHIFELKPKQLENYLRERGSPEIWVKFCDNCSQDVANLRGTFRRLHEITRKFEGEKCLLRERVKCSEMGRRNLTDKIRKNSILDECRSALCRHEKRHQAPALINPFEDGDLQAAKLVQMFNDHPLHNPTVIVVKKELDLTPAPSLPSAHGDDSEWNLELDDLLNFYDESCSKTGDDEMDAAYDPQSTYCNSNMESSEDEFQINETKKTRPTKVKGTKKKTSRPGPASRKRRNITRKCHRSDASFEGRVKVQCPVCKRIYSTNKSLTRFCQHFQSCASTSKKTNNLRCDLCNTWKCTSHQISEFIEHTEMCRKNETAKPLPWRHAARKCNLCEDSCYLPFPDYIVHVYNYHRHRFSCSKCPWRFKEVRTFFIGHWRRVHGDLESLDIVPRDQLYKTEPKGTQVPLPDIPWWCPTCFQEFQDEASRDLHITTDHEQVPERAHSCLFCGSNYFSEEELFMHRVIAHEHFNVTKPPECNECGKVFQHYRQLQSHRKNMHVGTVFACSTCEAKFLTNDLLNKHMQTEHGIMEDARRRSQEGQPGPPKRKRTYLNPKLPPSLKIQHAQKYEIDMSKVSISEDNSTFSCNVCSKQFTTSLKLIRHIRRVHDRSYTKICTICGIEVSSTNSLNVHMASVHFVGDFNCDECGMVLPTEGHLKQHKLRKHPTEDVKWTCEICGKPSVSRLALYQHVRYYHQGKGKKSKS